VRGALAEGDVVLPTAPFAGTWRTAGVFKAKALQRAGALPDPAWREAAARGGGAATALFRAAFAAAHAPGGGAAAPPAGAVAGGVPSAAAAAAPQLPLEYLAASRELLAAYRLLEMGDLKVGWTLGWT
jgi:hypothetical protein